MGNTFAGGSADVLLVDVVPDVVATLHTTPSLSSFRLIVSTGEYGALQLADRLRPAVAVVCVNQRGGKDGKLISLLKEILPELVVVATCDAAGPQTEAIAYARGATLYLPPPLDPGLLARVIHASLTKSKSMRPAAAFSA